MGLRFNHSHTNQHLPLLKLVPVQKQGLNEAWMRGGAQSCGSWFRHQSWEHSSARSQCRARKDQEALSSQRATWGRVKLDLSSDPPSPLLGHHHLCVLRGPRVAKMWSPVPVLAFPHYRWWMRSDSPDLSRAHILENHGIGSCYAAK